MVRVQIKSAKWDRLSSASPYIAMTMKPDCYWPTPYSDNFLQGQSRLWWTIRRALLMRPTPQGHTFLSPGTFTCSDDGFHLKQWAISTYHIIQLDRSYLITKQGSYPRLFWHVWGSCLFSRNQLLSKVALMGSTSFWQFLLHMFWFYPWLKDETVPLELRLLSVYSTLDHPSCILCSFSKQLVTCSPQWQPQVLSGMLYRYS